MKKIIEDKHVSLSRYEELERFIRKEIESNKTLELIDKKISESYLNNALLDVDALQGSMVDVYSHWSKVDAICVLASKLKLLGYLDIVKQLAHGYLEIIRSGRFGDDSIAMFSNARFDDESDKVAIVAIYFFHKHADDNEINNKKEKS